MFSVNFDLDDFIDRVAEPPDTPLHRRFLDWLATDPPGLDRATSYLVELPDGSGVIGDGQAIHTEFANAAGAVAAMDARSSSSLDSGGQGQGPKKVPGVLSEEEEETEWRRRSPGCYGCGAAMDEVAAYQDGWPWRCVKGHSEKSE